MSVDPVTALIDRVNTVTRLPAGMEPAATYPHILVFPDDDPGEFGRVAGPVSSREQTVLTMAVGETPGQCLAASYRVRDALEGWHPPVDGRASHRIRRGSTGPMVDDDSLPDKVLYSITTYWYARTNT